MKPFAYRGFTLIELLVVTSIIALLASIIFASFGGVRMRVRDDVRFHDFSQFRTALELHYSTYGKYPCGDANYNNWWDDTGTLSGSDSGGLLSGLHNGTGGGLSQYDPAVSNCDSPPYDGIYPQFYPVAEQKDPINISPESGFGQLYYYYVTHDRQSYVLIALLEQNDYLMENDNGCMIDSYDIWGGKTGSVLEDGLCD